jgi:hypothetical protein
MLHVETPVLGWSPTNPASAIMSPEQFFVLVDRDAILTLVVALTA